MYTPETKRKCLVFFPLLHLQSVLGKMNEIAKHKAAIEDAETQNKVSIHSHSVFVCDVTEKLSAKIHKYKPISVWAHMH